MRQRWNPLTRLRPRIALLVVASVATLALVVAKYSSDRLAQAYREAGQTQLRGIAATMDDGFRMSDLGNPDRLQARIARLKAKLPTLHKISVSWHDQAGATRLLQAGHEHDPDGAKRDVTSGRVLNEAPGANRAPIDEGRWGYQEVHAADGAHYAELNYPVERFEDGRTVAAFELHYDLAAADAALAADQRRVLGGAALAALVLGLLTALLLGRTIVRPIERLRAATQRIRSGDQGVRLGWARRDEIGALARDFDRMADDLQEVRQDALTGLLNERAFRERLAEELRRAQREGYPLSVVALDVGHLGRLTDRWGPATGDEALRQIAEVVRGNLRASDICSRVAEDELRVALVRATREDAERIAERVRHRVASLRVGPSREELHVTTTVSELIRTDADRAERLATPQPVGG
ncbi:MAG: GGDEF domain-containing protein [Actinomycetota bacterium]|nr:GGDEF domain-containing protein [Actinomycetota bacterium]